ncbi:MULTISPECIES: peptidoglycan DD-metalloendopeptidase family protein [unclassified Myroides]|uniref:M23 family metallopeptidase n=2 Tax=Myroides TaxID=76831 RepID=UPI0015F80BC8|nr:MULTISPECIES: peptidoglycan DD-metalloendopeptidase family protein [unclassified Myroides]MBB1149114.1 peptidoglycan DD-metalloendopeptidase family protein [Myroides sp. NP-2]MDM1406127.1 peptidoglycan DD-metalloendopeptidase family protein [Myroides sp. DF42-4-2]
MKYKIFMLLTGLLLFTSCKKEAEMEVSTDTEEETVEEIVAELYGFNLKDYVVTEDTIRSGDNLGKIFGDFNLNATDVHNIVTKVKDTINVRGIRAGQPYTLIKYKENPDKLAAFVYHPNISGYQVIDLRDTVTAYTKTYPVTIRRRTVASTIEGSLSVSLSNEGVDQSLATRMSQIFAWSIDFFKLQPNDRFAVTIEEKYINDTVYVGISKIEAAYFNYRGKDLYSFPYQRQGTKGKDYYDEEGRPMKSMFLKAPLKFFRITSRYTKSRFHPVQKTWKSHNGTDYAAPTGTPIMTTASGVVERTGYTAGNGNYVKVKHNGTYSTQYLHMSKILVKKGQYVTQGQTIGLVGSTGLATGPHVCYRFWKNGVQVDPLGQVLPNSEPMDKKDIPAYKEYIQPLKAELDAVIKEKFNK